MAKQVFRATLRREGGKGSWVTLTVPFRVEEVFGSKSRVPVKGTINSVPFRNSLMPNGDGTHYLVVNGSLRRRRRRSRRHGGCRHASGRGAAKRRSAK